MIGNRRLQKESKTQVKYYATTQTKSPTESDSGGEERKQVPAKLNFSPMTQLCQKTLGHIYLLACIILFLIEETDIYIATFRIDCH